VRNDTLINDQAAYEALTSRDPRFDGLFFVGVTSTGIYCRPICPVKTPQRKNCRFFASAEAAEKASFRPCLRCRPELAPGHAPVDQGRRIAHLITHRINEGLVDDGAGLEEVAAQFQLSSRQLRRIVRKELGVSPIELVRTRRLLLAKQLLTETALPVIQIAFASGFSSLRRFNDVFRSQYRMPPTGLRIRATEPVTTPATVGTSRLRLSYRPPFDWEGILKFLAARMIRGVEWVSVESYARTVRLGKHSGWIRVMHVPGQRALSVEFTHTLAPVLPALLGRLRNLFDLAARPDLIAAHLAKDPLLRESVAKNPGLRVPGAFDGFELAVRAILGQQITVKGATTLAGRFADSLGERIETPFPELTRLSPRASRVARVRVDDLAKLGILRSRSKSIIALARAFESGALNLDAAASPETDIEKLVQLPGIGPWTAHYIAMRASRWPDALPAGDIGVRNNLGGVSAKEVDEMSQAWRPWRSYAVMHIWNNPLPEKRPQSR
jgi:AraC family transcriptional regulator of adaptative response / DNA-3-methyladenine glycosylase II